MLSNQVPLIIRAIHRQLTRRSIKTRQCCYALLTELVQTMPGILSEHVSALIPGIIHCLNDKVAGSTMRIETLVFLYHLLVTHPPRVFHQHVDKLLKVSR